MRERIDLELKIEALRLYEGGLSSRAVAQKLGFSKDMVLYWARQQERKVRPRAESLRRYTADHHRFAHTPDNAVSYWLGFLLADGNVLGTRLAICLAAKDEGHLVKFRSFLGADHPIVLRADGSCRIAIHSKQMVTDLQQYGVIERKSTLEVCPLAMIQDRDFWRGMIDGDGWLCGGQGKRTIIGLCGSLDVCSRFLRYAQDLGAGLRSTVRAYSNIFRVDLTQRDAKHMIQHLYSQAPTYFLDRKMAKAQEILSA